MDVLVVVKDVKDWPLSTPGVTVVAARDYISDQNYFTLKGARVFNLCRSYRYQSIGYYVSLLAAARGHRPLPSINTIEDLKSQSMLQFGSDELDDMIQRCLAPIKSAKFELSIYFGRNMAKRYDRLCSQLFNLFPAPLLRAQFVYEKTWQLHSIRPIAGKDIAEKHHDFVIEAATRYFSGRRRPHKARNKTRYDLAILRNVDEQTPPSNPQALKRFERAAHAVGFEVEFITRNDYGRLAEFDALFIRETTNVNHHTFRFSRRGAAEGLVVVDDPDSILRCSNKVYLAELLSRHRVATPATTIITKENLASSAATQVMPCVLKQPDSAFSAGVIKVEDQQAFLSAAQRMLKKSELIIAQAFMPTEFDWRVGIFNRQVLFVCRYFMAKKHWQIIRRDQQGRTFDGKSDALSVDQAPPKVIRAALRAANLVGNGLYGVDIKQCGQRIYVIEINDNPNIDAGIEDEILKQGLYQQIMQIMMSRVEERKRGN